MMVLTGKECKMCVETCAKSWNILAREMEEMSNQGCEQLGLQTLYGLVQQRPRPLVPTCCMTDIRNP